MATKRTPTTEEVKAILTRAKAERIANVWITGDEQAAKAGGELATKIAKEACAVFEKSAKPTTADAALVTAIVAKSRKWSETSLKVRTSEILAIMGARSKVPAAITSVEKAFAGVCRWGDAVNAARAINDGKDPVRFVRSKRKGGDNEPKDAAQAKRRAAIALKKAHAMPKLPREWKSAIGAVIAELGIH